jgi:hypothetical protein
MNPRTKTVALFACAGLLVTAALSAAAVTARAKPEAAESARTIVNAPQARTEAQPAPAERPQPPVAPDNRVQVALLLDTSSSMNGLIDQAKRQLWAVVNELSEMERGGRRPTLEIALYEYGNSRLSAESGFIRRVLPLTTDLDRVSEELFALTTEGGLELCGQVIQAATRELEWSERAGDLKLVFIAGNEHFDQGRVAPKVAIAEAAKKGIVVNTIFCGSTGHGVQEGWKDAALLADGRYLVIDHNRVVEDVRAPQDAEIARLGARLNETYVPYGARGEESAARQVAQDTNAQQLSLGAFASRSISKASVQYNNAGWDLVDAVNHGKVNLARIEADALPAAMKDLSASERDAYVRRKAEQREQIQARIRKLDQERKRFLAEHSKKTEANTLDQAMIQVVREQAAKSGYRVN